MGKNSVLDVFDEIIDGFFDGSSFFASKKRLGSSGGANVADTRVTYDARADDIGMNVKVDIPGVDINDLTVEMIGPKLVVRTARDGKVETRKFTISPDYEPTVRAAVLENGVLTVRFLRTSEKTVKVSVTKK